MHIPFLVSVEVKSLAETSEEIRRTMAKRPRMSIAFLESIVQYQY
jgi:hypothetical protein